MRVLLMTSHTYAIAGAYDAPPIGLYRLKQYLSEFDIPCDVFDAKVSTIDSIIESIKNEEYNIIGISGTHLHMAEDLLLINKLKETATGKSCLFIAGGHEATHNYKQWLSCGLDVVFLGYAEKSLVEVTKYFNNGYSFCMAKLKDIDGIAYRYKNKIHFNPSAPFSQSEFDFFSYTLLKKTDIPYQLYWENVNKDITGLDICSSRFIPEIVRLYATSHCPNNCGYCSSHGFLSFSQNKKRTPVSMLSADKIYSLIRHYINEYGAKGFLFNDDEFFISRKRTSDLCDRIIQAKKEGVIDQELMFNCQARVSDILIKNRNETNVDYLLLDKISKAGFHVIGMGIETFCNRLLNCRSMNKKGFTEKETLDVLTAMLEYGIVPNIFLILFIPEATRAEVIYTMKQGIDMVRKGCQIVVNPLLYALPGSPIYADPEYPMKMKEINFAITTNNVTTAEYYIPKDNTIAQYAEKIWNAVEEEIDDFRKDRNWQFTMIPKTIVGILTFIAASKLMGEINLANEWHDLIMEMLENRSC